MLCEHEIGLDPVPLMATSEMRALLTRVSLLSVKTEMYR
jgi:hypothetical protein